MIPPTERPAVIRQLRTLIPNRPLRFSEALRLTELQANRFRELLGLTEPSLPEAAIASLPRIRLRRRYALPVSGLAHWHNGRWLIAVNASEPEVRQRFSLAHELFHVINHTTKERLHPSDRYLSAAAKGERLADYFAGCLLMPKRHLKSLVGRGYQPEALADSFDVSLPAIRVRLAQVGLDSPTSRCAPRSRASEYHRAATPQQVAA